MATVVKHAKRNGESKDPLNEKNNTTSESETTSASRNHSNEKGLTYEQKLALLEKKHAENNKKFFPWKDKKKAYLLFTDPDNGEFKTVDSTLDQSKKKVLPDGTIVWPQRDVCDQKVREITYKSDEEILGPELIWRMPFTAVQAFERFRKRRKFKLEVEKTGIGGQMRYMFYEIEREPYQEETEE